MKVFIIPSWYPSAEFPSTGIFFREQALIIAKKRPNWSVGVCLWGSHEPKLWVKFFRPLEAVMKLVSRKGKSFDEQFAQNGTSFFTPAFTWTRRWRDGNIYGITEACEQNLHRFILHFGKPDIIHAHVAYPAGMIAWRLSEKYQIPFVITEHQSPFPMPSFRKDYPKYILPPLQNAQSVMSVCGALADKMADFGVSSQVAGNFIDDDFFTPGNQPGSGLKMIAVGRLEPQKNYSALLNALKMLQDSGVDFEMRIVGSGSQEKILKKNAERLELSNLQWAGERDSAEIRDFLQQSSLFINCSHHENQPVAILEAMACGLPVISYDWAGASELIKPNLGLVVQSTPEALATGIRTFEKSSKSTVRSGFEEFHGSEKQVLRLEEVYRSVIK